MAVFDCFIRGISISTSTAKFFSLGGRAANFVVVVLAASLADASSALSSTPPPAPRHAQLYLYEKGGELLVNAFDDFEELFV